MRITTKNYFKAVSEVGFENLPEALKKSHSLIEERTDHGNDWSIYEHDAEVKRVFDLAFEKLFEFIDKKEGLSGVSDNPIIARAKADAAGYKDLPLDKLNMIYRLECDAELEDGLTDEIKIRKSALEKAIAEKEGKAIPKETMRQESTIAEKFVKRFLLLDGRTTQKQEIEGFLNDVQSAIKSKKIKADSKLSKEVQLVQTKLLSLLNTMGKSIKVVLSAATKKQFTAALNKENKKPAAKKVSKKTLSGVEDKAEVVDPKQNLMNSIDFAKLHFNSIGFSGKWLDLIGDPSPGFTAMVFGRPKMGKSYLCVDFAGYLARNHGTVLYVANEEKLDATLQMKLNDKDVKHENLFVSDYLPTDLSKYQFVILDSVNNLGLSPQDLQMLKRKNPGKSFIFIFQTTKDGKFKGANSYQHDVDVVIEVPERGKAVQFGRFNQGGEMSIFDDASVGESEDLNGVRKSRKNLEVPKKVSNVDTMKKKQKQEVDWTEPKHLNHSDWRDLKLVKKYYDEGDFKQAMNYASRLETIVREEIPPKIWVEIGGELTQSGKDRMMSKDYENRADDINPRFIFSTTSTALLVEALRGDFDLKQLVRRELANRGLNTEGNWVGFDKAAQIHKIKK
ncbi:MAG: hypothetical protein JNJ40_06860 [Bacteroidia bacterium]|nr:hypothetical protein [Bacteroidia bacterium]